MGLRGRAGSWGIAAAGLGWIALALAGCNQSSTNNNLPSITTQPANATVNVGQTATFTVVAGGASPLMYQWYVNGVAVIGATSASYTTPTLTIAANGDFLFVLVSNTFGSVESAEAGLTVNGNTGSGSIVRVGTLRNDPLRTGENSAEPILTPANVNAARFGKTGFWATDGAVDAQPLYMGGVNLPNNASNPGTRDLVFVVTEANSVYAFDEATGAAVWRVNLSGAGETAGDSLACGAAGPEIGISSTPVVDPARGAHGAIYVAAMTKTATGAYVQRLHALDLATGAEMAGSPVVIAPAGASLRTAAAAANGFDASRVAARGGLLLAGGRLYASFAPICTDTISSAANGWIVAMDGTSLAETGATRVTGSDDIAADVAGNIFADGTTTSTSTATAANRVMRLSAASGLGLADISKAIGIGIGQSQIAGDLRGVMLLPDQTDANGRVWHLALTTNASGDLFVVNRDSLNANSTSGALEQIPGAFAANGVAADAAYFNGNVYLAAPGNRLKAFGVSDAQIAPIAVSQSALRLGGTSASVSVSAAGTANGIVWVIEQGQAGTLRAFGAGSLANELYDSAQAAKNRDAIGAASAGIPATIASGHVYVATPTGVSVFGPLK